MKKRTKNKPIRLCLNAENFAHLRKVGEELGWSKTWISREINGILAGLVAVVDQAKKDAERLEQETDEVRKERYQSLMEKAMDRNR